MNPIVDTYHHHQAAHCESGVTSNLLRGTGLEISEAMAFGIGSGLFFLHIPFFKVMELPITSYRSFPGTIFKKTCKRLGVDYEYQSFRDPVAGTRRLDAHLAEKRPVGVRGNIYWLPYIPELFRFQFNAHNWVVVEKLADGEYLVSDPILESVAKCPATSMTRARFSKGPLSSKGLIFYPKGSSKGELPWERAIRAGIRETVQGMLFSPLPFIGVRGIRYLSRRMLKWPRKLKSEQVKLYMANVVRMQEEIGTGGAGFRYLYAAFLQEAGEKTQNTTLTEAARRMTDVGNEWRQFATLAAKFCKDRLDTPYEEIAQSLASIAEQEKSIYRELWRNYF